MKMKRWLSVFLCALLCIGFMPTMALAAEVAYLEVNGTNILQASNYTVACGNGSAVYDPATKTLTLHNADITSAATGNTDGAISFDSGDLTIVLEGKNTIQSSCCGITGQGGNLTITGEGSLDITAVYVGINEVQGGNITIDGARVDTNVSNSGNFAGTGLKAEGQLSILNGSTVNTVGETSETTGIVGNAGVTISDSTVTAKVLSQGSYNAIVTDNSMYISNSYVEADTSSTYGDSGIWTTDLSISDNSEVIVNSASGNAIYVDNQLSVDGSVVNATAPGDYPAIYAYGGIAIQNGSDVTGSGNFRGIFTDSSMTVNDSTVTASGKTEEGIVVVDTFSINNSKVTASGKPNDMIPAIVTYHLKITASDVTANGGIDLCDWYSGETTNRTFSIMPASGKLAEFKVDGTNRDGSAASHFEEGTESPYDAAVTLSENEMQWLNVYRYIHIGEHIHSGGTATCTEKAVCADCGKTYGALDSSRHAGKIVWMQTENTHSSAYDCCGATVVAEEAHTFTWIIDKEATATEAGLKYEECTACGYAREAVEIPATEEPAASEEIEDIEDTPEGKSDEEEAPQTDDSSALLLWMALAALAAAGLAGAIAYGRRRAGR